jgi:hypothetical protein
MHGQRNIKFSNVKQAKQIHQYKNTKTKVYKTNAAIWYNKTCRPKQLTPKYISIKVNGNPQCQKTKNTAIRYKTLHTSHPHRITSTKCCINTVVSSVDGPIVA